MVVCRCRVRDGPIVWLVVFVLYKVSFYVSMLVCWHVCL